MDAPAWTLRFEPVPGSSTAGLLILSIVADCRNLGHVLEVQRMSTLSESLPNRLSTVI